MVATKHRVLYFLHADESRRLCVRLGFTRLMKWTEFKRWNKGFTDMVRQASLLGEPDIDLSPKETRLLIRLEQQVGTDRTTARLTGAEGFALAESIVTLGRAFWEEGNHLRINWADPVTVTPAWHRNDEGVPQPGFAETDRVNVVNTAPPLAFGNDGKMDSLAPLEGDWPPEALAAWVRPELPDEAAAERFLKTFVHRFPDVALPGGADAPGEEVSETYLPRPVLRWMLRDTGAGRDSQRRRLIPLDRIAVLRLRFRYGDKDVDWHDDRSRVGMREDGAVRIVPRNTAIEEAIRNRLQSVGLVPRQPDFTGSLFDFHANDLEPEPDSDRPFEDQFHAVRQLADDEGWELVETDLSAMATERDEAAWDAGISRDERGWFHFSATLHHAGREIPLLPLMREFLLEHRSVSDEDLRERFLRSSFAVRIGPDEPPVIVPGESLRLLFDRLFELRTRHALDRAGRLRVSRWRAAELEAEEAANGASDRAIQSDTDLSETVDAFRRWREQLAADSDHWPEWKRLAPGLDDLRGYQRAALGWMRFLSESGTHGILADDMGLGKTFQVLAHLACEAEEGRIAGPILIVCPTSVIDNWLDECRRRTPTFHLDRHHGSQRERSREGMPVHGEGIVTSYATMREDAELLRSVDWAVVILDESQAIKNPRSETHQVACALRAGRRLCMTGTPVENHLGELWAQFAFLMPHYLGPREAFREDYEKPVNESDRAERRRLLAHLQRRLRPFVLRRTKEAVSPELPPKTEIGHVVEMTPQQAQCYEAVRLAATRSLRKVFELRGYDGGRMHALEALTRLRMICCDPRLGGIDPKGCELTQDDSAKLQRLLELLEELQEEGRRCLVFSQFVRVLDLIEVPLHQRGWPFLRLDGSTRNRGELVKRFEKGEAAVFLISLRAGGTGLNLTAADTVIHFDPWWNPAVEQQATDRAHRLGQEKPVFVHRLTTAGTVEEGITELHARKREIATGILDPEATTESPLDPRILARLLGEPEDAFS